MSSEDDSMSSSSEEEEEGQISDAMVRQLFATYIPYASLIEKHVQLEANPVPFEPTLGGWRRYHYTRLNVPEELEPDPTLRVVVRHSRGSITRPQILQDTKADGNCFFRAISLELTGGISEDLHQLLRGNMVDFMREHKDDLESFLGTDVENYLTTNKMEADGTWATDSEIIVMATMLQTPIVIYTNSNNNIVFKFYTHVPLFDLPDVDEFNENIYLSLIGQHFERIIR